MLKRRRIWLVYAVAILAGALIYFLPSLLNESSSYEGTELTGEAPDFQLTDQHGSVINLFDFRGNVVILTFMDSQCKDTCPLTAAQIRQVYWQLDSSESDHVTFIGVNVNIEANAIVDIYEITQTWHLDEIPTWHFVTGGIEELTPIWQAYSVSVVPQEGGEIIHTPGVFLIDQAGQKRWYISTPYSANGNTEWTLPLSELLVTHIREILGDG